MISEMEAATVLDVRGTVIEKKEYLGNRGLEQIIIPPHTEQIQAWGFAHCKKLRTVYIPKTISYIEETAFDGCDALEEIIVYEQDGRTDGFSMECIRTYPTEGRLLAFGVGHFGDLRQHSLFDFSDMGTENWYARYDKWLVTYVNEDDGKDFHPFLAGGEEDYEDPSNSIDAFCFQKQQEKILGILYRLSVKKEVQGEEILTSYIREHRDGVVPVLQSLREDSINGVRCLHQYGLLTGENTDVYLGALEGSLFTETRAYLLWVKDFAVGSDRVWNRFEL